MADTDFLLSSLVTADQSNPQSLEDWRQGAHILVKNEKFPEAESWLLNAAVCCGLSLGLMEDIARISEAKADWKSALLRWTACQERFPSNWSGFGGAATALRELGRLTEAEALLLKALEIFPREKWAYHDLARIWERRGDWNQAEKLWREALAIDPDAGWAYVGLAAALRFQGRPADAEELIRDLAERREDDATIALEYARLASASRNLEEGHCRWVRVRRRFPDLWEGYTGLAGNLRERGEFAEAEAILREAVGRFPKQIWPRHDIARLAEHLHDWGLAERHWRELIAVDDRHWWAYVALASVARHQHNDQEEEKTLRDALLRFPDQVDIVFELAWVMIRRLDWDSAAKFYSILIDKFPSDHRGYVAGAHALQRQFRVAEAREMLEEGVRMVSENALPRLELARLLIRPDVAEASTAIKLLEETRKLFPNDLCAYRDSYACLKGAGKMSDARMVVEEAVMRWPNNSDFALEHAKCDGTAEDINQRLAYFRDMASKYPKSPAAFLAIGMLTAKIGDSEHALASVSTLKGRFSTDVTTMLYVGEIIEQCDKWDEALLHWQDMSNRFPDDGRVRNRLHVAELRCAETSTIVARRSAQRPVNNNLDLRDLAVQFESMGGTGQGCEFGVFQRECGVEPLGLLRWTGIEPEALIAALECEFEGVGLPENTSLYPGPDQVARAEYSTEDRNFGMRMHTFVHTDEVDRGKFYNQICRRLQYLRRKFLDDLRAGDKVFVYKIVERRLADSELKRLHKAMRQYGDNTLLYVGYGDASHADGTVEFAAPGLLMGYVDRFQVSPTGQYGAPITHTWEKICRSAYYIWRDE